MMTYVIACGDEGVQMNQGTRLAFAGAGFRLPEFSSAVVALKKVFGKEIAVAASEENAWVKDVLGLVEWDQVNASMEQQITAMADREELQYAGYITFSDPKVLKYEVKAHMVRPHAVHVANKICFTLGGGEQKFNLGCYVISADWVAEADLQVVKEVILSQVAFYRKLAGKKELTFVFEEGGELGEEVAAKNRKALDRVLKE